LDLPSLPTDSLYKFVALTGLALALFAITYPQAKLVENQVAIAEANAQSAKLTLQIQEEGEVLAKLEGQENPSPERLVSLVQLHKAALIAQVDMKRTIDLIHIRNTWIRFYVFYSIAGFLIGTVLSVAGFYFWYKRVQEPVDRALSRKRSAA
jgi:hypothetical protein